MDDFIEAKAMLTQNEDAKGEEEVTMEPNTGGEKQNNNTKGEDRYR